MADYSQFKQIDSSAAVDGDVGTVALAVRQDSLVGLAADGKYSPLFVNADGALYVAMSGTISVGSMDGEAAHDAVASAVKPVLVGGYSSAAAPTDVSADGDATNAWFLRNGAQVVNIAAGGTLMLGGAGTAAGAQRVTLASDDPLVATTFVDDAAFTPATSKVIAVGFQADETATDSVDEGDVGCPRMTLTRQLIVSPYAHTAGGATPGMLISAGTTNATVIKASAGTLYSLVVTNINAAVRYIKFYNKASTPDENDTPVQVFAIPGATTGGGFTVPIPACGIAFGTGLSFRTTTGVANNDTGAVSANEHTISYSYK